jgi:uncharacterized integral membrane protein
LSSRPEPERRPPAPWGSFPLAELTILAGLILLVVGFFGGGPRVLAVGVVLAGLGGLEVSIREHFAGYRSHTTLLAAGVFVVTISVLGFILRLPPALCLGIGAVAFALAFLGLRRAFQRASGGLSFRVGGLRG